MPDIFKALATITAWTLFIIGWVAGLSTFIGGIIGGGLYGGTEPPPMIFPAMFAVTLASFVLAVVVMVLRKKME